VEPHSERKSIDSFLRPIARKLHRHTANLERMNAQLDRGVAERDAQLEVVRAALNQEIKKRLWAEQELTQANLRLQDQALHDGLPACITAAMSKSRSSGKRAAPGAAVSPSV